MAAMDRERWQRVSPLLDELLEADADTRVRRLAQVRTRDRELAAEVEALLRQQAAVETAQFLEGSALGAGGAEALAGQVVGSYTLERALGAGGMGTVWLARRSDGRYEGRAAVKFLNLGLLGQGGAERFRREGSALARLTHPNIAHLVDAGVSGGQPYLVLEYVQGEPIDRWCDGKALDVQGRIGVFLQVLAAVSHAHGKLILHRDLKPTNILVSAEGRVKLLDFGIAKLLQDDGATAAATELTQRAFTPEYAAPEQVQGAEATMATDVYALGVLLWVLLVGEHPTARVQGTAVQRLQALVEAEAGLASERARRVAAEVARARGVGTGEQLARQLRGDLDNIVGKALKKAPGERYATVQALADDLQRYLDHEPVSARADSAAYRVAKFVRRHRIGVGAATAITLALVAGVAGTAWQAVEARRAQARAEANERDARRQRAAAEFEARVARANHEFLSQVFGDAMRGGESDRMRQRLDRALEMVRRRYADDPQIHAILLMQVSGRYAELGDDKRAAEVIQEIEAIAARTQDRALSASVECIRAYDLLIEGRRDEAAPFIARGLALMDGAEDVQSAAAFECLRADAMLAALKRDLVRARARMGELLALLESNGRARTRAYRSALGSLAYVDHLGDDPAAALAVSRRAIVLDEQLGTADTINGAVEFDRQAGLLAELGRMTEALQSDAQLRGRFAAAGEALPMGMRVSTARRALLGGRTQEAVATLREAVAFYAKDGPEIYARGTLLDLADALWMLGRPAQATLQLQQYERRLAKAPEGANEGTEAARLRALLALERGDRVAARAQVDDLLARLDSMPDAKRRVHLKARLAAGWVLLRFGETDAARRQADLARALAEGLRLDGQTSAWAGAAHLLAARIAQAAGDAAAAERALNEARRQLADTVDPAHPLRAAAGHTAPH